MTEGVAASARLPANVSHFSLLRHFERIVYFDAKVSNCTFQLGMSKQQLDGAQILCSPIDQRDLRASHAVRAVRRIVESNGPNPVMYDP